MNQPETVADKREEAWPSLPLEAWRDTYATLHMWAQIGGKIKLALNPRLNHWWQVPYSLTARGLTTTPIPYGSRIFELDFDFIDHVLWVLTNDGARRSLTLGPRSVADFYGELMATLEALDIRVKIWPVPVEVEDPIPFAEDTQHAAYAPEYAQRFWRILLQVERVFKQYQARFVGKSSPVQFFWGSFDLVVTRFSGRRAPARTVYPWSSEAESHEHHNVGFWPGSGAVQEPAFYAYAYPQPKGMPAAAARPGQALWHTQMGEFILPYEAVRTAEQPDAALLAFCQSTYEAAAGLGDWDRTALDRPSIG